MKRKEKHMMNNNENQKKSILNKLISFLKRLFTRKNNNLLAEGQITEKNKDTYIETNNMKEQITIPRDIEKERLLNIREQWENGEIEEEDMSEEDVKAIVAIYNEETYKIEQETEQIKQDIAKMLKELKESA